MKMKLPSFICSQQQLPSRPGTKVTTGKNANGVQTSPGTNQELLTSVNIGPSTVGRLMNKQDSNNLPRLRKTHVERAAAIRSSKTSSMRNVHRDVARRDKSEQPLSKQAPVP
jgi:hypothetical protein